MNALIKKWQGTVFDSSTGPTEQFLRFARAFRSALRRTVPPDWEIAGFSRGHFELSGFLRHKPSDQWVYWHISDVRAFPDEWVHHVLIRTAAHDKDYMGGLNHFTSLDRLIPDAARLLGVTNGERQTAF